MADVVDTHRSQPGFPFVNYFRDADEHAGAAAYWTEVLASIPEIAGWQPVAGPPAPLADGQMALLQAMDQPKLIELLTSSREGVASEVLDLNGPMDDEAIRDWTELVGADPAEPQLRGMHDFEALEWAEENYRPFIAFVQHDPDALERLVLIAEISPECEALARQAIALFAIPGPAAARIADRFGADDDNESEG